MPYGQTPVPEWLVLFKKVFIKNIKTIFWWHFSKLFVILQIAREENVTPSEFWAMMRPFIILNFFFINTYYLQPLCSCNGKNFLKKIKKPSEIFWIQERWRTFRTPCIYDISRIVSYNWFFFLLFDGTKVVTSRADLAINEQSWDFFRRYRNKIRF